ncbi:MAG: ATPase [Deltaproteobacteria bacterium]|nr:MAG: ATPase [Deltaproteobacteria bacterium]
MEIAWKDTYAAVWRPYRKHLHPVQALDPVTLDSLIGIERQKQQLTDNTRRFLERQPANNALLWGARGTGKSSLVKALLNHYHPRGLRMIEIYKDNLYILPEIVDEIRDLSYRFIIFLDDFTFEEQDNSYIPLKSVLEGSIEQPPENVLIYATSNRRHLLPEYLQDNLDSRLVDGELHYADAVEERISLSDRFGLWISFHQTNLQQYLRIVDSYFPDYQGNREELHEAARLFAMARGSRNGRTAKQFYNSYVQQS